MKKRILITGASGYLGGHLILNKPADCELFALYRSRRPVDDYDSHWLQGDFLDAALPVHLLNDIKPDAIIHNAALSKPDECETQAELANEINVEATDRLAEATARCGAKLVHLSTDMIFDGEHPPYSELSETRPLMAYGRSKLAAEPKVLTRSRRHLIVRSAVMYGGPGIFNSNFAITMLSDWQQGRKTPVFIDQIRSHVGITWLSRTLFRLAQHDANGILNLGGSEPSSRAVFARALAKHHGISFDLLDEVSFKSVSTVPRPRDVTMELTLANKILSDDPPQPLAQGIAEEWKHPGIHK